MFGWGKKAQEIAATSDDWALTVSDEDLDGLDLAVLGLTPSDFAASAESIPCAWCSGRGPGSHGMCPTHKLIVRSGGVA